MEDIWTCSVVHHIKCTKVLLSMKKYNKDKLICCYFSYQSWFGVFEEFKDKVIIQYQFPECWTMHRFIRLAHCHQAETFIFWVFSWLKNLVFTALSAPQWYSLYMPVQSLSVSVTTRKKQNKAFPGREWGRGSVYERPSASTQLDWSLCLSWSETIIERWSYLGFMTWS